MKQSVLGFCFCAMFAAAAGQAYIVQTPNQAAEAMAQGDVVVIGRIVGARPYDDRVPLRTSILVVDEVFAGSVGVGDSLQLPWRAPEWHPAPGVVARDIDAGTVQVDAYVATTALWVLCYHTGDALNSPFKFPGAPYALSPANRVEIAGLVDQLEARATATSDAGETEAVRTRLETIADRLRRFLELDSREH